jgi:hypothetical protein
MMASDEATPNVRPIAAWAAVSTFANSFARSAFAFASTAFFLFCSMKNVRTFSWCLLPFSWLLMLCTATNHS